MDSPKAKLAEGPVGRHLVNMTVPILIRHHDHDGAVHH